MKLTELLASFIAGVAALKAQANTVLAGLPPLEQHEATSEIAYGIRSLQRYGNELVATAENLEKQMGGFVAQAEVAMTAEVTAKAEEVLLAAGNFIKKVDAEAAQVLALAEKEKTMRDTFTAEAAAVTKIKDKRAALVSTKEVALIVAEALPDALLAADDVDAKIGLVKARLTKLTGLGLTPELAPKVFAEVAGLSLDAAGDATFASRFDTIQEARGAKPAAAKVNPLAGAGTGAVDNSDLL